MERRRKYLPSPLSVEIPEGVTSIDYAAFGDCTSLESVSLPSTLTSIKAAAFWRLFDPSVIICSTQAQYGLLISNNASSYISTDRTTVVLAPSAAGAV